MGHRITRTVYPWRQITLSRLKSAAIKYSDPMHICPYCRTQAVSNLATRWSSRGSPATCRHCGKLSHVLASTANTIFVLTVAALGIPIVVWLASDSVLWTLASCCLPILGNIGSWRQVELVPISSQGSKVAAAVDWGVTLLAFFTGLFP